MIELLRKMFEANPEKTTIVLIEKCSGCGREINIEITPTSSGFGLQGGVLFKCNFDEYLAKCPVCYKANPKIDKNSSSTAQKKISQNKP
jgi:hypothetical protein